ncbi:hypothetical protein HAX54_036999 [Datura stramonium]|uniref:NAC domain-containing protein n=1 Tax=Datura stramonium TaxID=4076 RepID=A0ABS8VKG4_DATST|nr:hypothetical protein [Datura stramonium]
MGMKFQRCDDEDLISYLMEFICGMPIECHHIPHIDLRVVGVGSWKGRDTSKKIFDKEGSVIGLKRTFRFDEESSGSDNKRMVYWIMKEYCVNESTLEVLRQRGEIQREDSVLCSITRKVSLCKKSRDIPSKIENVVSNHLDYVPNSGYSTWPLYTAETRLPPLDGPFQSLTEEELAFFDKPDPGYPQPFETKNE